MNGHIIHAYHPQQQLQPQYITTAQPHQIVVQHTLQPQQQVQQLQHVIQPQQIIHHQPQLVTQQQPQPPQPATPVAAAAKPAPVSGKKRKNLDENGEPKVTKRRWKPSLDEDHNDIEKRAVANSRVTADGRYICGECGNSLANSWGLDAHIKTVHGKKTFTCEYCDKAFKRRDHLVNHTNSIHTGQKKCSQCGATCKGKEGLLNHIKEFHPSADQPATPATPATPKPKKLPSDVKQFHADIKAYPHAAPVVRASPPTAPLVAPAQTLHQQPQILQQAAPQQVTVVQAPVATHVTPTVPAKTAASPLKALGKRETNSKGEMVHKCNFCSGAFIHKSSLEQHVTAFHVEVTCQQCGSQFIGHESMAEHVKETHQPNTIMYNEYQVCFHCELCNITFQRRGQYDEHFLSYHVSRNGNGVNRRPSVGAAPAATVFETKTVAAPNVATVVAAPATTRSSSDLYDSIYPNNNPSPGVNSGPLLTKNGGNVVVTSLPLSAVNGATVNGTLNGGAAANFFGDADDGIFTTELSSQAAINGEKPKIVAANGGGVPTTVITNLSTQGESFYSDLSAETNFSETISQIFLANGAGSSSEELFPAVTKPVGVSDANADAASTGLDSVVSSSSSSVTVVEEEPQYQLLELGEPLTA